MLKISLEKNRTEFPRLLVENALKNFGTAFETPLDYSIHYDSHTPNMIQRAL